VDQAAGPSGADLVRSLCVRLHQQWWAVQISYVPGTGRSGGRIISETLLAANSLLRADSLSMAHNQCSVLLWKDFRYHVSLSCPGLGQVSTGGLSHWFLQSANSNACPGSDTCCTAVVRGEVTDRLRIHIVLSDDIVDSPGTHDLLDDDEYMARLLCSERLAAL